MEDKGPQSKKLKFRITVTAFIFLVIFGILADILGATPFVNLVTTPISYAILFVWFWILGINFRKPTRWITALVTLGLEMFPLTSWIPAITLGIIITCISATIEDIAKSDKRIEKVFKKEARNLLRERREAKKERPKSEREQKIEAGKKRKQNEAQIMSANESGDNQSGE